MEIFEYYRIKTGCKIIYLQSLYSVITTVCVFLNPSRIKSSAVSMIMSDFISISPLTKSAVKSQAAYYFRKLLTHWPLLLVFDFCINVEIWFLQILNAKPLRVSLAPEGQRSLW